MKAGKNLVSKQFFGTDTPGKHFWSFNIPDQTENGVAGVLVVSLLCEGINYLTDTTSAKEVAAFTVLSVLIAGMAWQENADDVDGGQT